MDKNNAIEVRNLKKYFKVYLDKSVQLKEKMLFWKRNRYENREVLKGISFDVKKGEAVGLIGHNGCGKSTTLKLLTKIIYPTDGTVEMAGRVSSLIELGAGFHPDMSGRENIYINASIFGLSRKEIDKRIDGIIEFSELAAFIDNPVRTYSSGMYMRLAFAVAINVDADILLVDEILAVGDTNFQSKCFDKLKEIKKNGTTIIIVSHDLGQIERICDRSIWIHEGHIKASGKCEDVHVQYQNYMNELRKKRVKGANNLETWDTENRYGDRRVEIIKVELLNQNGEDSTAFDCGEDINVRVHYKVNEPVERAMMGFGIFHRDGANMYGTNTHIERIGDLHFKEDGTVDIALKSVNLLEGGYILDLAIQTEMEMPIDFYKQARQFDIFNPLKEAGIVRVSHDWKLEHLLK